MLIDGKEVTDAKLFKHASPTDTRIVLPYFPRGNLKHVSYAIASAYKTFQIWRTGSYQERLKIFTSAAERIVAKKFELSAWITFECGKNRFEAMSDVDEAIDFIRYYCTEMISNKGYITEAKSVRLFLRASERNKSVMKRYEALWSLGCNFAL